VRPQLAHVGIYVWDLERMTDFYTRVFDLEVTDRGRGAAYPHDLVFLSASPSEHHQLVLVSGRPEAARFSTVMQLSFKVESLTAVRVTADRALAGGASRPQALNHGNAWSVYCDDVEGNTVEIYADTPWHVPQPFGQPLDLARADHEIENDTEARCRATDGFLPRAAWIEQRTPL
jgi:catechol 2,3-dioxygenase